MFEFALFPSLDEILYAFDLLHLNGEDLRQLSLLERKRRLQRLIRGHVGLLYAEHIEAKGVDLFRAICDKDLEGVVSKYKHAAYRVPPIRWVKVLNPDYSQKRGRQDIFENFRNRGNVLTQNVNSSA